ncbi:type II toxin-antitoxin system RatA family toxin [Pseudomonadota bacterium]
MPKISRSALVNFSAAQMYGLVADISSYKDFLPWCSGARITAKTPEVVVATLDISYKGLRSSFTTRNQMSLRESIQLSLLDGPFTSLQGLWKFDALEENACKISLDLEFSMKNSVLAKLVGQVFGEIASEQVDAFHQRAQVLYG